MVIPIDITFSLSFLATHGPLSHALKYAISLLRVHCIPFGIPYRVF